jgi:putative membrane protein
MTLRRELNAEQLSRYLAPDDLRHVMAPTRRRTAFY